jgi:glycosyltransferase involved in cell wall biosynthesis
MKKTIYIDVTDFVAWQGNFSGIQRVVYEVGIRLATSKKFAVKYVYYSDRRKQFFNVKSDVFEDARRSREARFEDTQRSDVTSTRSKIKHVAKAVKRRLPSAAAKVVKRSYQAARHRAGLVLNNLVRPGARFIRSRYPVGERTTKSFEDTLEPLTITANDTFLILGQGWYGPKWYRPTMIGELVKLRSQIGFDVSVLIHDIIPIRHPEFYDMGFPQVYNEFLFETLIIAKTVFVISKATQNDVERYCEENYIATPNIVLIREGDGFETEKNPTRPARVRQGERYVLAVGSFEARKNYGVLYQAIKQAQLDGTELPKLIIVGRRGFLSHDLLALMGQDHSINDAVLYLDHVSDAELAWLYSNALFTVYPSICEGWGLPVAEALFYGKLCITSNVSSLPEVGGKLADYVSPYDVMGWKNALHTYGSDEELLAAKTATIKKSYKPYSWDDTVRTIEQAL